MKEVNFMQKFFRVFSLAAAIVLAAFAQSAEALEHFHAESNDRALIFSDSLTYESGLVEECLYFENGRKTFNLGQWQWDVKKGTVIINYEKEILLDASGKIIRQYYSRRSQKLEKNGNKLSMLEQDGRALEQELTLNRHEYVWGNDQVMAGYMLEQYMKSIGKTNVVVMPCYDQTGYLDEEMQAMLKSKENSANGLGAWLQTEENDFITGVYYVESDPKAIYKKTGKYLTLLEKCH